ncbi:hypothetical protein NMY22_g16843 [Coprinellus aureogranulatus]|nr:hypothetical protein NMY22_g16843 [Coprinellus aureogranulatus]
MHSPSSPRRQTLTQVTMLAQTAPETPCHHASCMSSRTLPLRLLGRWDRSRSFGTPQTAHCAPATRLRWANGDSSGGRVYGRDVARAREPNTRLSFRGIYWEACMEVRTPWGRRRHDGIELASTYERIDLSRYCRCLMSLPPRAFRGSMIFSPQLLTLDVRASYPALRSPSSFVLADLFHLASSPSGAHFVLHSFNYPPFSTYTCLTSPRTHLVSIFPYHRALLCDSSHSALRLFAVAATLYNSYRSLFFRLEPLPCLSVGSPFEFAPREPGVAAIYATKTTTDRFPTTDGFLLTACMNDHPSRSSSCRRLRHSLIIRRNWRQRYLPKEERTGSPLWTIPRNRQHAVSLVDVVPSSQERHGALAVPLVIVGPPGSAPLKGLVYHLRPAILRSRYPED